MATGELNQFLNTWEKEAKKTLTLLESLPRDQYDFRPDAGGRSLGELAWHLPEAEALITYGIEQGGISFGKRPPGVERPRQVEALAPGYHRLHDEAVARVRRLQESDLDRTVPFVDGKQHEIRSLLWEIILLHHIHHRGQLSLMCRLAGGVSPNIFGPNREQMAAFRAAATA